MSAYRWGDPATRYPSDVDALAALDEASLIEQHAVAVDWREEEDSIVVDFGRRLAPGDSLFVRLDDDDLRVTYNGAEYEIPLTQSRLDRYVTLCSLASILSDRYEVRIFAASIPSDTHVFLLLLREHWERLDRHHGRWVESLFERVPMGEDGWTRERVPYVER